MCYKLQEQKLCTYKHLKIQNVIKKLSKYCSPSSHQTLENEIHSHNGQLLREKTAYFLIHRSLMAIFI